MEFRVLRYFLEVARQRNFTLAARNLNLTQPTLSKQIMELEEELGETLLIRGKRKTELTEAGKKLQKYAGEILELVERAKKNLIGSTDKISGDVYIAGGETKSMSLAAKAMKKIRDKNPDIKFHIFSGNAESVAERLEKGLADFGFFVQPANLEKFDYINLPMSNLWGLLIRKDDPLACRYALNPADLDGVSLICSAQHLMDNEIHGWMGNESCNLQIVATYTLLYNAAIMVQEGLGAALCLDGIVDTSMSSSLCFRPLNPPLQVNTAVAWRKEHLFSPAAALFQQMLLQEINFMRDQ